jgi:hypothetical protein
MSWLKAVGEFFARPFRRPAVRNVAGIADENRALGEVREVVQSGGPLKPGHRRLALRDPRLLPKPKPARFVYGLKKPKLMSKDEARRLFAGTMLTRDRNVRDLLADDKQLQLYGLPLWRTEAELAEALGIPVKQLRHYAIHREAERVPHYVAFEIPKRSGGSRLILAPKKRLKALQRKLLPLLVDKLPCGEPAHGFRKARSVRTNAQPHVGRRALLKLDLQDFFPSVTFGRVRGLFISLGYGYPVATALAALCTEAQRQPVEIDGKVFHVPVGRRHCVQGAPTSPGICNAVVWRLDRRLAGLARKRGFAYTRYADDLTFSGDDLAALPILRAQAERIVAAEGFRVNAKKGRICRRGQRQLVTGVVVNQVLGLSRQKRRLLRAEIHRALQQKKSGALDAAAARRIDGKLAYLRMLNPQQAEALEKIWKS